MSTTGTYFRYLSAIHYTTGYLRITLYSHSCHVIENVPPYMRDAAGRWRRRRRRWPMTRGHAMTPIILLPEEEPAEAGLIERAHITGLDQPFQASGRGKVRKAALSLPIRLGAVWSTVTVSMNEKAYTTAPDVQCNDCKKTFNGGVTRIKVHILKQCSCSTIELQT